MTTSIASCIEWCRQQRASWGMTKNNRRVAASWSYPRLYKKIEKFFSLAHQKLFKI